MMELKTLMGSGRKIWMVTLPFLILGIILNILFPKFFDIAGPSDALKISSIIIIIIGITIWIWSAILIITRVPKKELITTGPYSIIKHPLYTSVALLVFPWIGLIFNTWIGVAVGVIMYIASRRFAPQEEKTLSKMYGKSWDKYVKKVKMPWL